MPIAPTSVEFEYVLQGERELPVEDQTVFLLKVLGWKESRELEKITFHRQVGKRSIETDAAPLYERALGFGLVGWRNFLNDQGEPVEFQDEVRNGRRTLPQWVLDLLAPYAKELVDAITERSAFSDRQAKNFS